MATNPKLQAVQDALNSIAKIVGELKQAANELSTLSETARVLIGGSIAE